ncbi:glycine betaine ABC transporter substrate-binding protein [Metabacillus sediminilitoris]
MIFNSLKIIMQSELRYAAVNSGKIILVDAYSTDCELRRYDLTVLEDEKHLFPPYQGAPLLKQITLEKYPELRGILNKRAGLITDEEMRKMNYEVAVGKKKANSVAKEF